jgi:hypothetical protein
MPETAVRLTVAGPPTMPGNGRCNCIDIGGADEDLGCCCPPPASATVVGVMVMLPNERHRRAVHLRRCIDAMPHRAMIRCGS